MYQLTNKSIETLENWSFICLISLEFPQKAIELRLDVDSLDCSFVKRMNEKFGACK